MILGSDLNLIVFDFDGVALKLRWNRPLKMDPAERDVGRELSALPQCLFQNDSYIIPATSQTCEWISLNFPNAVFECPEARTAFEVSNKLEAIVKRNAQIYTEYVNEGKTPNLSHVPFKRPPMDHQKVGFACAANAPFWGLTMDMRTGKTKTLVDVCSWHAMQETKKLGRPYRVLLIVPANVLINWAREIQKDCFVDYHIAIMSYLPKSFAEELESLNVVSHQGGELGSVEGILDLLSYKEDQCHFIIATYDALKGRSDLIKKLKPDCIALDESHRIKAHSSKRTQFVHELALYTHRRYILTGTPLTQTPMDLYPQFEFLGPKMGLLGYTTFYAFQHAYAEYGGYMKRKITSYKNSGKLLTMMARWSTTIRREQCMKLPPKTYEVRYCTMTAEQQKVYDGIKADVLLKLESYGSEMTIQNVLVQYTRLAQVACGYFVNDKKEEVPIPNSQVKIKVAMELLEESNFSKTIIWCRFVHELDDLERELKARGVDYVRYSGGVSKTAQQQAIDRFQTMPHVKVFLGSAGTGGEGISLTKAEFVFYLSQDFSMQRRLQTEDRAQGSDQTVSVGYFDIMVEDSIDQLIYDRLQRRRGTVDLFTSPIEMATSLKDFLGGYEPRDLEVAP